MKRMLLVFAHPDDETFVCGGTIAKYAAAGWEIHLICATRGELGNRGPYGDIDGDSLGTIRQKELETVGKYLGIANVAFLDYKDGTLTQSKPGDLEEIIFRTLRSLAPAVVVTFEPGGISNHPDHIRLTRATTFAFQKYTGTIAHVQKIGIGENRPPRHPRDAWQIEFAHVTFDLTSPKLYYACLPKSIGDHLVKTKVFPTEMFGKPWSTTPDKFITTVIDTKDVMKKKKDALWLYETQKEDVARFMSDSSHVLLKQEFFVLRMQGEQEVFMGKNDRVSDRL
ncbi:PIG-L family deacetylase [Candidatus Gottesmanbacteria bacterium]|nr:PIG-L family deacetylase [Candidatus Gottesmanbacteria bacterium]